MLRTRLLPGAALLMVLVSGCYSLRPAASVEPLVGTRVAFDLNDAGRDAVAPTMGQDIGQVDGRLIAQENGEYVLSVLSVHFLRGGEQAWSGEQVRLKKEYVGARYERRFSAGKSVALAAVTAGAIGGFLATRSLLGTGQSDDGGGCENPDSCNPNTRLGRLGRP
jgi:hypothetical protein